MNDIAYDHLLDDILAAKDKNQLESVLRDYGCLIPVEVETDALVKENGNLLEKVDELKYELAELQERNENANGLIINLEDRIEALEYDLLEDREEAKNDE